MIIDDQLITHLRLEGYRITPIRKAIVRFFCNHTLPQSIQDIQAAFKAQGVTANRTTIYREIEFFVTIGHLVPVELGEGKRRYELAIKDHHHHLVCTSCQAIEEIVLIDDLQSQEADIMVKKQFRVTRHLLEFFGICARCQKQQGVV